MIETIEAPQTPQVAVPNTLGLPLNVCQILRRAKALIDNPIKWMQGNLTNGVDRYCAIGALAYVTGGNPKLYCGARDALMAALPPPYTHIEHYNDSTDHDRIMSLFDRAILTAEEQDPCHI